MVIVFGRSSLYYSFPLPFIKWHYHEVDGPYRNMTLGEIANQAAQAKGKDAGAEKAIKMVKQAGSQGKGGK